MKAVPEKYEEYLCGEILLFNNSIFFNVEVTFPGVTMVIKTCCGKIREWYTGKFYGYLELLLELTCCLWPGSVL